MCSGSLLACSTKPIATTQESLAHQQTLLTFTLRYDRELPGIIRDVNIQALRLRPRDNATLSMGGMLLIASRSINTERGFAA